MKLYNEAVGLHQIKFVIRVSKGFQALVKVLHSQLGR